VDKEGRERVHRKRGDPQLTPQVLAAIEARKAINKKYDEDKDFVFTETSKSTSGAYTKKVASMKQTIDAKYQADMKEVNKAIDGWKAEQKQADIDEKKALEPKRLSEVEKEKAGTEVNAAIKAYIESGDKTLKNSPFRKGMYDEEKKWAPVRSAVTTIYAYNQKDIPIDKIVSAVATMTAHIGSDADGQKFNANQGKGEHGSRFQVLGKDLNGSYVVAVGVGDQAVELHMPATTLASLKHMKKESYSNMVAQRKEDLDTYNRRQGIKKDTAKLLGLEKSKGSPADKIINWAIGPKPPDKL
jgi:hypothetical protein